MSNPTFLADTLHFPPELTNRKQWLAFRLWHEPGDPKLKKLPYSPHLGTLASSDNPDTWTDYRTAITAVRDGKFDGLGFAMTPETGLAILDLENCIEDGVVAEWARREIEALNSFTEVSASGTGIHVLAWGEVPSNLNRQKIRAELWGSSKLFCLTGNTLPGRTEIKRRSLLPLHGRIERGEIGPAYDPPRIPVGVKSHKFLESADDNYHAHYASRSDAVMGVLTSLAHEHGDDADAIRDAFERTAICEAWTDSNGRSKWERLGDSQVAKAIEFVGRNRVTPAATGGGRQNLPTSEGKVAFTRPAVPGKAMDFIIRPKEEYDGWFPRSGISLVGGSSGAGKTTLIVEILEKQARGESALGHPGAGVPYLVICDDRGKFDNQTTLRRMRLDPADVPVVFIDTGWGADAAAEICAEIERRPVLPAAVFIEGADMMIEDANKVQPVTMFLRALRRIAEHYHLALILSVGAPKTKPKEQYAQKRDRIFGSQAWPRRAATVITFTVEPESAVREVSVEHRDAKPETFQMEFQDGRLRECVGRTTDIDPVRVWVETLRDGEEWFTRGGAVKAMDEAGTGLGRSAVHNRIKKWEDEGLLEQQMIRTGGQPVMQLRIKRSAEDRAGRKVADQQVGWTA